jgi:hypothetical protein
MIRTASTSPVSSSHLLELASYRKPAFSTGLRNAPSAQGHKQPGSNILEVLIWVESMGRLINSLRGKRRPFSLRCRDAGAQLDDSNHLQSDLQESVGHEVMTKARDLFQRNHETSDSISGTH